MSNGLKSIVDSSQIQEVLQQKDQRITALEGELFVLKEQLDWLKKQIFGSKSERIVSDLGIQPLLPEFDLGTTFVPAPQEEISYKRNKPVKNRGCDDGKTAIKSSDLTRIERESLVKNGFLRQIVKGWYMLCRPGENTGDSTPW